VLGTDTLWLRPAVSKARYYPGGWPAGARIDATGARFTVPTTGSVLPALGTATPNAQLQFANGGLISLQTRNLDISTSNVVKNQSTDTGLKLSITKATGLFSGTFTHTDSSKLTFKGIILQEGANAKGFGFFLSTPANVVGASGQGGGVTLQPQP